MKKILFAALMISMVGAVYAQGTTAVSSKNVYSYQASIKRLNANYYLTTPVVNRQALARTIADQYSVVSDTVRGYVVIDRCQVCANGTLTQFNHSRTGASQQAYAYLTRVGDTYMHRVFKVKADVTAGLFGAFIAASYTTGTITPDNKPLNSTTNMNQAWMALNFHMPNYIQYSTGTTPHPVYNLATTSVLPNVSEGTALAYGFYGVDNQNAGILRNSGFGVAAIVSTPDTTDLGWCGSVSTDGTSCQTIRSITGSTIGDPIYQGPCGLTPMWDVCYEEGNQLGSNLSINEAVVCGTWVLAYDAYLSGLADGNAKDEAILSRLGTTLGASNVIDVYNQQ